MKITVIGFCAFCISQNRQMSDERYPRMMDGDDNKSCSNIFVLDYKRFIQCLKHLFQCIRISYPEKI